MFWVWVYLWSIVAATAAVAVNGGDRDGDVPFVNLPPVTNGYL